MQWWADRVAATKKAALMDESMFGELDELSLPELPDSVWMRLFANALDPDAPPVDDGADPGGPAHRRRARPTTPACSSTNWGSATTSLGASIDDGDAGDDPPSDQPAHHDGGVADDSYGGEFDHPAGDFGTSFARPFCRSVRLTRPTRAGTAAATTRTTITPDAAPVTAGDERARAEDEPVPRDPARRRQAAAPGAAPSGAPARGFLAGQFGLAAGLADACWSSPSC